MLFEHERSDLFCFYDKVKRLAVVRFLNSMTEEIFKEAEDWLERLQNSSMPVEGILCDLKGLRRFAEYLPFQASRIPLVFLISHPHQATTIQKIGGNSSNNYKIAAAYDEAFRLFEKRLLETHDPLSFNSIGASIFYDEERCCSCVTYYGIISPIVTADVYKNQAHSIELVGIGKVRGALYDFRRVTDFDNSNLSTLRRTSTTINATYDMNHIAVALIVGSTIQERMVEMAMKFTSGEARKRLVRGIDEAYNFVDEFQLKRSAKQSE